MVRFGTEKYMAGNRCSWEGKTAVEQQTVFIFQNALGSNVKTMFRISDF